MNTLKVLLALPILLTVGARALAASAELSISETVSPTFVAVGSEVTFTVRTVNWGPDSAASVVIADTLPAALTLVSCATSSGTACGVSGGVVKISLPSLAPTQSPIGADAFVVTIVARLSAETAGGAVISNTATVAAATSDPNPADNSATSTVTAVVTGIRLAPAALDFGFALVGRDNLLAVKMTNVGTAPVSVGRPAVSRPFYEAGPFIRLLDECFSDFYSISIVLAAGASCDIHVSFLPNAVGPASGTMRVDVTVPGFPPVALPTVPLSGTGHWIYVGPGSMDFGTVRVGEEATAYVGIVNVGAAPLSLSSVTLSGADFSKTTDCGSTLLQNATCYVAVTFSPSSANARTGTLTFVDDDLASPQVVSLRGTGTAVSVSPPTLEFLTGYVGDTSLPRPVTVRNVGKTTLTLGKIAISGDFSQKNDCGRTLAPGASCEVSVTAAWKIDGPAKGALSIADEDPTSPQVVALSSIGVGTTRSAIFVHYDYMVASDHTHDPEALAPGSIGRVIEAFRAHGIELIVDPRHTAIPEVETMWLYPAPCGFPGFVSFYDLRAANYQGRNPREHYGIFGHSSSTQCGVASRQSGQAELPGQNFIVSLGLIESVSRRPDLLSLAISGTFMHELGHNLGLTHGGNGDGVNYKPNFLSVMNYEYQVRGIPLADSVGSTVFQACRRDSDCGEGGICVGFDADPSATTCVRLDYSGQLLPRGGNTPGVLDETDLDETAGLGSGTRDIFFFDDCEFHVGASDGPVDWDGDGAADNPHSTADLHFDWDVLIDPFGANCPSPDRFRIAGADDWAFLRARVRSAGARELDARSLQATPATSGPELDLETAKAHHALWPVRSAAIAIEPRCGFAPANLTPGRPGAVSVALLGGTGLDLTQVDLSSLRFHRAEPMATYFSDVNGDGVADLVAVFDSKSLRLNPAAKKGRLTGWLASSQRFFGEAPIVVVTGESAERFCN